MQTRQSPSRETLIRLALRVGISNPTRIPKSDLFHRLHEEYDFERLMRAEIRKSCVESKTLKRKREEETSKSLADSSSASPNSTKGNALNRFDPIMMIPIGKKKTFKFHRPNGTVVQFNVDSLVDYLLSSGDFHDPETRLPFRDEDLQEIDKIARAIGLQRPSVFEAKHNTTLYSDAKFRRDALLALERCAGEVITEMLSIAEDCDDPEDAQMELVMHEFPIFQDLYRQMKSGDAAYASKCLAHWRLFVKGPPNHPNEDDYGIICLIANFLNNCE